MPTYTYRCDNCGVQFERHQGFHDSPLSTCPECSKKSLRKVIAPVGIVFKGSGWYATDHRSPSGASRASKSEGGSEGSTSTSADKSTTSSTNE